MNTTELTGDFGTLTIETDMIDVTTGLPGPDKAWRFTDANGHEHYWSADAYYPTLKVVVDRVWWCSDCNDEHEDDHLECKLCGEVIVPGTVGPSPFRTFAPGPRSAFLNGEPISPERADDLIGQAREAAAEALREKAAAALRAIPADDLRAELARREAEGTDL